MTGGKIVTKEVFASRVEEMIPVLYRVCRAHFSLPQDREDAVQEALVRAWEKRDTLRDERYMQTWLIRILLNVCNGIHRKRRRAERAALPPPQAAPAGGADAPGGTDGAPAPASPAGGALLYGRNDAAGVRKGAGLARKPGEKPAACRACGASQAAGREEEAE